MFLSASEQKEMMCLIHLPKEDITKLSTKIKLNLENEDGKVMDKANVSFLGRLTSAP